MNTTSNVNTFAEATLQGIRLILVGLHTTALVKRSRVYTRAVVVGTPNQPGCMAISQAEEADADGRFPWNYNLFADLTPGDFANGVTPKDDIVWCDGGKVYYWGDLVRRIAHCVKNGYVEE